MAIVGGDWSFRRRAFGLLSPVACFAIAWAGFADGSVARRLGDVPVAVVVGIAVFLVPGVFVLAFVRSVALYLACVVAFCASVPVAFVSANNSDSSTAGLYLLWMPYIACLSALTASAAEALVRLAQRRRASA